MNVITEQITEELSERQAGVEAYLESLELIPDMDIPEFNSARQMIRDGFAKMLSNIKNLG